MHEAPRARVADFDGSTPSQIIVQGVAPELPPLIAAHAYRIRCEALTNALRHADADRSLLKRTAPDVVLMDYHLHPR